MLFVTATPALLAVEESGLAHRVIRHGPVRSLTEAAAAAREHGTALALAVAADDAIAALNAQVADISDEEAPPDES